ncbi:MAG: hypothetical protein WC323_00005 [Patescibacteria group bacterium]|jgi:hypothetical protein
MKNSAVNFFNKTRSGIKEHRLAIALSFLLTILIFAPLLAFPKVIKSEYQGINIIPFGTDAHFYLSRAKEVLDGNGLGNPVLKDGKNERDPYFAYNDYILLAPIKLLGLSQKINIVTLYYTYNFIGVFFIILLIYFLIWQMSKDKLLSITAALAAIGGYSIVYHKALFYSDFNTYTRIIYPFMSSLIFFSYLNLLYKSLKSKELKYKIFTGAVLGLLFYAYFYAWSFTLAFNASLILVFLLRKDFSSAKKVLLISSIGLALGSYNLTKLFLSFTADNWQQFSHFMWVTHSRAPIFSKIGFITLVLFGIYFYKRRDDKNLPFIFAIILGGWIALNQQIISGRILQYGHYYFYFIVPLSIVISFYMVWHLIKHKNLRKYLFIAIIIVVFANTAVGQYKSFFVALKEKKYEQNFRPIINYLNQDQSPTVILADQPNAFLYTIYTSHDLFWQNIASVHNIPLQRFKDALFVYLYLNQESRDDFRGYLERIGENKQIKGSYYNLLYRNLESYWTGFDFYDYMDKIKTGDPVIEEKRPAIINQLTNEYNELVVKNNGINQLLKKYEIKYIVWDKNNNPEWDLSGIGELKEVVCSNNICLYSLAN